MLIDIFYITLSISLLLVFSLKLVKAVNKVDLISILKSLLFIAIAFVHFTVPLCQRLLDYYRYQRGYEDKTHFIAIIYTSLFLVMLHLAFSIFFSEKDDFLSSYKSRVRDYNLKNAFTYLVVFFVLICIPASYVMYTNLTLISNVGDEYMANRISVGTGRGFFVLLPQFIPLFAILMFSYLMHFRNTMSKASLYFLFISLMIINIFSFYYFSQTGSRNSIFIILINTLLIYFLNIGVTKKNALGAVFITILLVSLFSYLGNLRKIELGYDDVDNISSSMVIMHGVNGAYGNDENLLWLIENGVDEYYLGITYLAAPLNFIPRNIWSEKPVGGGPRLVNTIYPGSYEIGAEGVSSLTTGVITESYQNFSFLGFVITPVLLVALIKTILYFFRGFNNIHSYTLLSYLSVAFSISLVQAEFLGLFTRVAFIIIAFLSVKLFIKFLSRI